MITRKTANIILKAFVIVWIIMSIAALVCLLCVESVFQKHLSLFLQLLFSLLCSVFLLVYIWKVHRE